MQDRRLIFLCAKVDPGGKLVSKRDFTLLLTLRMAFSGWHGSWSKSGTPDALFVTYSWNSNLGRYQMEFNSGP